MHGCWWGTNQKAKHYSPNKFSLFSGPSNYFFRPLKIQNLYFSQKFMWLPLFFIAEIDSAYKFPFNLKFSDHSEHKFKYENTFRVIFRWFYSTWPNFMKRVWKMGWKFSKSYEMICSKCFFGPVVSIISKCIT